MKEVTDTLKELGADRRELGKSLMPTQISSHQTLSGLLVRRWQWECGHVYDSALLTPPKACPTCRDARHAREREGLVAKWERNQNRTIAAERAEKAHDFGKPHIVCARCVDSRAVDAKTLCEAHASMFSQRKLRGFKEGE